MQKDIKIDGINIHYDDEGPETGLPVILMHGWGCDGKTVKSISDILSGSLHVFNIDLPGHGESDEPESVWGVEDYSRLIEKFIALNNIDQPSLIGHSFGGRIAIVVGSRNPIRKMVLVDAAGVKPKRSFEYYRKVYIFKTFKKMAPFIFGKKKAKELIDRMRKKNSSADYRNASPVMRGILSKCVNEDLQHLMPSIKSPVLLVWGENDTATPMRDARIMENKIPDAGLVSFPGCGHYSFLDNPFGFKAVLKEFFKEELARKK